MAIKFNPQASRQTRYIKTFKTNFFLAQKVQPKHVCQVNASPVYFCLISASHNPSPASRRNAKGAFSGGNSPGLIEKSGSGPGTTCPRSYKKQSDYDLTGRCIAQILLPSGSRKYAR